MPVDGPEVGGEVCAGGEVVAVVVDGFGVCVGDSCEDGDGAPAEGFFDEGNKVGDFLGVDVGPAWGAIVTDYCVHFCVGFGLDAGEVGHGEDAGEHCAAGCVDAAADDEAG